MSTNRNTEAYVEEVYRILREGTVGLDSVYEEYIITLIGTTGLTALLIHKYLETCGVVNGRQLYVLCCEKES
jgi:hypothetical protein